MFTVTKCIENALTRTTKHTNIHMRNLFPPSRSITHCFMHFHIFRVSVGVAEWCKATVYREVPQFMVWKWNRVPSEDLFQILCCCSKYKYSMAWNHVTSNLLKRIPRMSTSMFNNHTTYICRTERWFHVASGHLLRRVHLSCVYEGSGSLPAP